MSARGRFLSVLVTIVVALAGFVTVGALPAAAAPTLSSTLRWATPTRQERPLAVTPNCLQSAERLSGVAPDSESRIDLRANLACSGATTSDVVADTQLSALNSDTQAGDPDRWCRRFGSLWRVDRVYCRTAEPNA